MKNSSLPARYLHYLFNAKGAQGIHSPFVFELYNKVIAGDMMYYEFGAIEKLREQLLHSKEVIETVDFGAGSGLGLGVQKKKISDIVKRTSVSPSKGRVLFRLVNYLQPKVIVEMGTSLGISTLYIAKASPDTRIITMEGSPNVAEVAKRNFSILKASNIKQVTGEFEETFPIVAGIIRESSLPDLVFIDGNHRKEATIQYFHKFLSLASEKCVFVFDDIRWSAGMFEAWNEIIKEPCATVTIDLLSFGIVFLNLKQAKENFILWRK